MGKRDKKDFHSLKFRWFKMGAVQRQFGQVRQDQKSNGNSRMDRPGEIAASAGSVQVWRRQLVPNCSQFEATYHVETAARFL